MLFSWWYHCKFPRRTLWLWWYDAHKKKRAEWCDMCTAILMALLSGVAHAPEMLGTFSPPLLVSDTEMHHGTFITHVPWCMLGSLTCGFLWSRWRGKLSRHSWRMRNLQFYVSCKRHVIQHLIWVQAQQFNLMLTAINCVYEMASFAPSQFLV